MADFVANFDLENNEIESDFGLEQTQFDAILELNPAGANWGSITGNIENQIDLKEALDSKADVSYVEELSNTVSENTSEISNISDVLDSFGDIVTYNASDFATKNQGELADTALQPNDNISELNNDVGYITDSALSDYATQTDLTNGLAEKQDTISDLDTIRSNAENGQSAYTTIQNYGDVVTYNASDFATYAQGQLADTSLQPNDNISELNNNAGYITSASLPTVNNNKVTIQKNSTDVGSFTLNQSTDKTINLPIPTQASDINAVPTSRKVNNKALSSDITLSASDVSALPSSTTINDLTTLTQQDALNSGATSINIGQIATNTSDITAIEGLIPVQATTINQLADKSFVNSSIATNTAYFIGTFNSVADLEAYSGTLTNNDYAFVETTDSAGNTLYDRYKYTTATTPASWQFEYELNNSSFTSNQWASINSGITANDVTLIGTAIQPNDNVSSLTNDAGYITSSSLPTVNNGTLTIQQNGTDVQTFTANQSTNVTANITVPTKTSDLTNNSGFIDNSALASYATQTDLTNGLATKQDTISDLSTIRSNAANGQSAYTTIGGYGDIVTYNASGFVQKNGGSSTQTISLTSGTGTTALSAKSMSTSSYISLSGTNGWLGSYGVSSNKRAVFYNGTGYTLAYTSDIPTNVSAFTNDSGYITGITSTDVTTALGYTPYSSANPSGYTSNVGTVTSVNNTSPDANGNVTISVSGGANTDLSNLTATGENHFQAPLVSGTNIKTINNTSLLGSGDIDTNETFLAIQGTTQFSDILVANNTDKRIFCKYSYYLSDNVTINNVYLCLSEVVKSSSGGLTNITQSFVFSTTDNGTEYITICDKDTGWSSVTTRPIETTSNKVTSISSSSTNTQYPSAKSVLELLKTIYPVGSVYLSTNSTCPLASLFGTWTLVSSGRALWTGTGSNGNTTIAAGLPNIKGALNSNNTTYASIGNVLSDWSTSGALSFTNASLRGINSSTTAASRPKSISFDAHSSNMMYDDGNTTVQPPAYVVNVWRRTA